MSGLDDNIFNIRKSSGTISVIVTSWKATFQITVKSFLRSYMDPEIDFGLAALAIVLRNKDSGSDL